MAKMNADKLRKLNPFFRPQGGTITGTLPAHRALPATGLACMPARSSPHCWRASWCHPSAAARLQPATHPPSATAPLRWCWHQPRRYGSTACPCLAACWALATPPPTPATSRWLPRWQCPRRWRTRVGARQPMRRGGLLVVRRAPSLQLAGPCGAGRPAGPPTAAPAKLCLPQAHASAAAVPAPHPSCCRAGCGGGGVLGGERGLLCGGPGQPAAAGAGPRAVGGLGWAGRPGLGGTALQPALGKAVKIAAAGPCSARRTCPALQGQRVWGGSGHRAPHRRQRHAPRRHAAQRAALQGWPPGCGSNLQRCEGLGQREPNALVWVPTAACPL